MTTPIRCAALLLLLVLLPAGFPAAQNVVIVVVDGLRASEGTDAGSTYLPRLWNDLRPAGMVWPSFRNDGVTTTVSGHASVLTGTWQNLPNDGTARPTAPTLFEYFRASTGEPESAAVVVAGKAKLNVLTHSTDSAFGAAMGARFIPGTGDTGVISRTRGFLAAARPRLVLLNLPDVDGAGHAGDWPGYLAAIRRADSLVHSLWLFLSSDSFYAGRTTLFVTNDHGRHDDAHGGFRNHGDGCEGCRRIMLFAVGRAIPAGLEPPATRTQRDIAPAVGALLGITLPELPGTSVLLDTLAVPVEEEDRGSHDLRVPRLEQCFPNPFNPSTTISYTLGEPARVSIGVYDLLGRRVEMAVDALRGRGRHEVRWDAGATAAGVYLVTLEARPESGGGRTYRTARKAVLLR